MIKDDLTGVLCVGISGDHCRGIVGYFRRNIYLSIEEKKAIYLIYHVAPYLDSDEKELIDKSNILNGLTLAGI